MPGHSYKGSSASVTTAAVFPPTPTAGYNGEDGNFTLSVVKADCVAGRPGFIGFVSNTGIGNPTTNRAEWFDTDNMGNQDDALNYIQEWNSGFEFFIGRCFYGFNFSGWSNIVDLGG